MNPSTNIANTGSVNPSGGRNENQQNAGFGHQRNKYNRTYNALLTPRFGEITPFYVEHTVPDDTIPLRSKHELRTFTLKSPLMSNVRMFKTYAEIPMDAILPNTWELIYTNPVQGDDVPDYANCVLSDLKLVTEFANSSLANTFTQVQKNKVHIARVFLLESIFSYGSLPAYLGDHYSSLLTVHDNTNNKDYTIDDYIDGPFTTWYKSERNDVSLSTIRYEYDVMRDDCHNTFDVPASAYPNVTFNFSQTSAYPINYDSCLAYQLMCAEFFTNQFIDHIFSAKLYRDNAMSIYKSLLTASTNYFFTYNGNSIQYDAFSGKFVSDILKYLASTSRTLSQIQDGVSYLQLIFSYRQSLRNSDYFTTSKKQPLAVGNVNAVVVDNKVSAVDMSANIQRQRFLNAVHRVGNKFSDYVRGIMGSYVPSDRHEPHFISQSQYHISGFEIENTNQNIDSETFLNNQVTSLLTSRGSDYEFSVDCPVPSIIIGVLHFDVIRNYADSVSKFAFKLNRYDMFNPFMQYIGDQSLFHRELYANSSDGAYGYQVRNCEYKQRYSVAAGAFASGSLPSWAFVESKSTNPLGPSASSHITSLSIRNMNTELDRFYASLPYVSLANNCHFIISMTNESEQVRPIDHRPNIL
ncbi:major capsid protein [Capybara microvirus Cap3_SP_437]|nr:major capsid protein [Capybara microvirus Cap3_SP_437]